MPDLIRHLFAGRDILEMDSGLRRNDKMDHGSPRPQGEGQVEGGVPGRLISIKHPVTGTKLVGNPKTLLTGGRKWTINSCR